MNFKAVKQDILKLKSMYQNDTTKTDQGNTTSADLGFLNLLDTFFFKTISKIDDNYYSVWDLIEENNNSAFLSYFLGKIILEQITDIYRWNLYYMALSGEISKEEYENKVLVIGDSLYGDILVNKDRDDLTDEEITEIKTCESFYNNNYLADDKFKRFIIPLNVVNKYLKSRVLNAIKDTGIVGYKNAFEISNIDEKIISTILSGGNSEWINIDELIKYYCIQFNNLINRNRISKVICKNMFGYYNCCYDFKDKEVSIVFGPNAFGKTTMLNILSCCFDTSNNSKIIDNLNQIKGYRFEDFTIYFNDMSYVKIHHLENDINFTFHFTGVKQIEIYNVISNIKKGVFSIDKYISFIRILFPNLKGNTRRFLKIDINRSTDTNLIINNLIYEKNESETKKDFEKMIDEIVSYKLKEEKGEIRIDDKAEEIRRRHLRNYVVHSPYFDLDNILKLVQESKKVDKDKTLNAFYKTKFAFFEDRFEKMLNNLCNLCYEDVQKECSTFCYLSENKFKIVQEIIKNGFYNDNFRKINFKLNIKQNEADDLYSLSALISLFKKYKMFKKYFESFYDDYNPSKKYVFIDKNKKLMIKTFNEENMHFYNLSSGEVNVALILSIIIFDLGNDSVLLIDEPEISLHIVWQEKLLNNILEIINLKGNTQLIMACHSPFISGGREELIVEPKLIKN